MTFQLPPSLQDDANDRALAQLRGYYQPAFGAAGFFTGAAFDTWDSTGNQSDEVDRFTADDLVAVTFLSVSVGPRAAHRLLKSEAERFNQLLKAVGPDRDFVDVAPTDIKTDSPAWELERALRELPDVGRTISSKLMARKRPRLVPIYDKVLRRVMGLQKTHWAPLNAALRADDQALHHRLLTLRDEAGLPERLSPLRVLDVIAWRDGKDLHY